MACLHTPSGHLATTLSPADQGQAISLVLTASSLLPPVLVLGLASSCDCRAEMALAKVLVGTGWGTEGAGMGTVATGIAAGSGFNIETSGIADTVGASE